LRPMVSKEMMEVFDNLNEIFSEELDVIRDKVILQSDNAREFKGAVEMLKGSSSSVFVQNNIKINYIISSPHQPQTNGAIERAFKTVKQLVILLMKEARVSREVIKKWRESGLSESEINFRKLVNWSDRVDDVLGIYNNRKHDTIGMAPVEVYDSVENVDLARARILRQAERIKQDLGTPYRVGQICLIAKRHFKASLKSDSKLRLGQSNYMGQRYVIRQVVGHYRYRVERLNPDVEGKSSTIVRHEDILPIS
jgi:hypothetical protein